jgi:DNA polymerase IIIc chi subunit
MSSRKVVINGVTYIRSRDAARAVDLALDYVSRLARHGVISGQRVSGIWFVDLTSLQNFIVEQERQKQLLRARFAQMRREEQRLAGHPAAFA